ncbi:MAG: ferredoxin family protein, partial [Armatimonadota bacterium]
HIAHTSEIWRRLRAMTPSVVCTFMHPRQAHWVLASHGISGENLSTLRIPSDGAPDDLFETVITRAGGEESAASEGMITDVTEPVSERWYPVIDRSRCVDCGHCYQFCIFGVYERKDDGTVIPAAPDNCKPGCPACARICPNSAIMFPMSEDPAIAGVPGHELELDTQARTMYYMRTGAECPKCDRSGEFNPDPQAESCPECGRPLEEDTETHTAVMEEIDALIDDLDRLAGGDDE